MIFVDGHIIENKTFPDNTPCLMEMPALHVGQKHIQFTWCFDAMEELVVLSMASMHYKDKHPGISQRLCMPYVPNARMDRVKDERECFTLKWFCHMLNSLEFERIEIFDVHSDVAPALISHVCNKAPNAEVKRAIELACPDVIFFPDAGAAKRYGSFGLPVAYGNKSRDWKTGKISGLDILGNANLDGVRVLIVDDISSYGGTFHHASRALRAVGASEVSLYVSHAEKSVFAGKLFDENDIDVLYTTDSLFTDEDVPEHLKERIVFVKRFRDEAAKNNTHPSAEELRALV